MTICAQNGDGDSVVAVNATAQVVLLCGPSGSGKTVRARELEAAGYRCLSIDRLTAERAGPGATPGATGYDPTLLTVVANQLAELVAAGQRVVVDESLCHRSRRDQLRDIIAAAGGTSELIYFDVPRAELHRRVATRVTNPGFEAVPISPELLDQYIDGFEVPGDDEVHTKVLWKPSAQSPTAVPDPSTD